MAPFDFLLLAIIVGITLGGYGKGFVKGAVGLLALVLGLLFAVGWYDQVAATVLAGAPRPIAKAVAFGCIAAAFAIAGAILSAVLHRAAKPLFKALPEFSAVNKILGAVTGVAEGVITSTIFVFVMLSIPGTSGLMRDSRVGQALVEGTHAVARALPRTVEEAFTYAWHDLSTGWEDLEKR